MRINSKHDMNTTNTQNIFRGMPSGPDVRKLLDAFGALQPGLQITHAEMEDALVTVRYGSQRYKTVVAAWRKTLLDRHNIDIQSVPGIGYRVLNDEERVDAGLSGSKRGLREIVRSARRSDRVITEDPVLVHKQAVQRRLTMAINDEFKRQTKALLELPPPMQQQPRIPQPTSKATP
jgi:hypothetical protein